MSLDTSGTEGSTPVPLDPDAVTTSSLKALQSEGQRKVMDIVDKLRRTGLSGIVELPQLVVCILILLVSTKPNLTRYAVISHLASPVS
jgi:hypothetical protein